MLVKVCAEIDLSKIDSMQELVEAVYPGDVADEGVIQLLSEAGDLGATPCYFDSLVGSEYIKAQHIPLFLEAAFRFSDQQDETILLVSVTSIEDNYKEWLEVAEGYPGATITKVARTGRTVFALMFPGKPDLALVGSDETAE